MRKTDLTTGSILEIPLEKEFGFGYVKLIFSKDVQPNYSDWPILKVYNIFRKESFRKEEFNKSIFETDDLVMYPLLMIGFPSIRGKDKWIFKGFSDLTEEDNLIPDYLKINMEKKYNAETLKEAVKGEYGCLLIRNFEMKPIQIKDFEKIKHIGRWIHSSPKAIRTLITMLWMNRQDEEIMNYYNSDEIENDFWLKFAYNRIVDNDIDYSKITYTNRFKAKI